MARRQAARTRLAGQRAPRYGDEALLTAFQYPFSVRDAREYLEKSGVQAPFTFVAIPYANHSAAWVLRDIPERRQARQWLSHVTK